MRLHRGESRLCDALDRPGFLVRITGLLGKPEGTGVFMRGLGVLPRSAPYIGDAAQGNYVRGRIAGLLRDQPGSLVVNQGLVETFAAVVDGADVAEHVSFVGQVADLTVDEQCLPVCREPFLMAALVMVHIANVVKQDRPVLFTADLGENIQRLPETGERIAVEAAIQLYLPEIIECLRFAASVGDRTIKLERGSQVFHGFRVAPELAGGDSGVAQGPSQPVLVTRLVEQRARLSEVGESFAIPGRALVDEADLIERLGKSGVVTERAVDRR